MAAQPKKLVKFCTYFSNLLKGFSNNSLKKGVLIFFERAVGPSSRCPRVINFMFIKILHFLFKSKNKIYSMTSKILAWLSVLNFIFDCKQHFCVPNNYSFLEGFLSKYCIKQQKNLYDFIHRTLELRTNVMIFKQCAGHNQRQRRWGEICAMFKLK